MKAQLWSLDFVFSLAIFCSAISIIAFSWSFISAQADSQRHLGNMESIALDISDSLIRTAGQPLDWNSSSVMSAGLASSGDGMLNQTKVDRFIGLDYNQSKQLLGIGIYEFYFEMSDLNGTVLTNGYGQNITAGFLSQDSVFSVPVQRLVLLERNISRMKFILWL